MSDLQPVQDRMLESINKFNSKFDDLLAQKNGEIERMNRSPEIQAEFNELHKDDKKLSERNGPNWFINIHHKTALDHQQKKEDMEAEYENTYVSR